MNDFTEIYIKSLINENEETDLQNSTELLDEDQKLVSESFGNWIKNFWKTGSKKEKMLLKLIAQFSKTYRFAAVDGDPDLLGKIQDKYKIYLDINQENLKKAYITVHVVNAKTDEEVVKEQIIQVKYSWTVDELADKVNDQLLHARIELSKSGSPIPDSDNENDKDSSSNNEEKQSSLDGIGGFKVGEIKDKLNEESGSKETKLSKLKTFISGWKKLSSEEQKFFEKLK